MDMLYLAEVAAVRSTPCSGTLVCEHAKQGTAFSGANRRLLPTCPSFWLVDRLLLPLSGCL
jgi:hypothetical protein